MKSVAAYLVLLIGFFLTRCAQQRAAAVTPRDDSMVAIHGGTFQMGIDAADIPRLQKTFAINNARIFQDELPRHPVAVKDFLIDKNLVTNAQFRNFLDADPARKPDHPWEKLDNGNYLERWKAAGDDHAKPDHPVVNVTWYAAVLYCRWAGKRLPTEAEWEFAARGGRDALFPWGDDMPDETRANFNNNVSTTTPVGSYPANPYGLFDMAGNVWQFLSDRWAPYSSLADKSTGRMARARRPELETLVLRRNAPRRVIRGGSFAGSPVNLWVEYRDSHPANGSQPFVGFRCAKSPTRQTD